MQVILGSGGNIGKLLASELAAYTKDIRLISRKPVKINEGDSLYPLDVTKFSSIEASLEGASVVYVTVGFQYNRKVWERTWPPFMSAVIHACKKYNARLVFFDNMYLYDKSAIADMAEDAPVNPPSRKGSVRAEIAGMVMREIKQGSLNAVIARAADFYGPGCTTSVLHETVHKNLRNGKAAQWFGSLDKIHNFTYVPDAARATALLGNTPAAFNRVWHLPSNKEKLTGRQWVSLFASELNVAPDAKALPIWLIRLLGVFVPVLAEFPEMGYQYLQDYYFNSSFFEKEFNFAPVSAAHAVREIVRAGA